MHARLLSLLIAGAVSAHAGTVVSSSMSLSTDHPFSNTPNSYLLTVNQDSTGVDFTGVLLTYESGQLSANTYYLDESADLYLVAANQPFSAETVAIDANTALFKVDWNTSTDVSTPLTLSPGTYYLGVVTGSFFLSDPPRTDYGWAQIQLTGTELMLTSSAMTFDDSGIVVGTLTAIPEASTYGATLAGMFALGVLADGSRKRRQTGW